MLEFGYFVEMNWQNLVNYGSLVCLFPFFLPTKDLTERWNEGYLSTILPLTEFNIYNCVLLQFSSVLPTLSGLSQPLDYYPTNLMAMFPEFTLQ